MKSNGHNALFSKIMQNILNGCNDARMGKPGLPLDDSSKGLANIAYDLGWQSLQPRNGDTIGFRMRFLIHELERKIGNSAK